MLFVVDKGKDEKQNEQTRVEPTTTNTTTTTTKTTANHGNKGSADDPKKRVVTMEPSVRSFANPQTAARRDRSEPVMITDALADVRVK